MAKRRYKKSNGLKLLSFVVALIVIAIIAVIAMGGNADNSTTDNGGSGNQDGGTGDPIVKSELQVHFIDIGQGDCILVVSDGKYMLVDTGDKKDANNRKIINYLKGLNITKLDYLILTHPDADHIGGAPDVINNFEIEKCIMTDYVKNTVIYDDTLTALEESDAEVIQAEVGETFNVGEVECEILAPLKKYEDVNDASIVIHMTFGENTILLTGDAEAESEADMVSTYSGDKLKADVLKSGHHGSRTSSSDAFLDLVKPEYVVISCGMGNSYGHPHAEALQNYEERNIDVYRTDISGTIILKSDGKNIIFVEEK